MASTKTTKPKPPAEPLNEGVKPKRKPKKKATSASSSGGLKGVKPIRKKPRP